MKHGTFERFRSLIYEKSGINLGPQKESLVSARVGKRMRALKLTDYEAYFEFVRKDDTGQELVHLLDAISTNVTSFFREPQHFDFFTERLAEWFAAGQTRFRVWSAASSTGEEPYTIAITALEVFRNVPVDFRVLATDISTKVLESAREGRYNAEKIDGVPPTLRSKYFAKQGYGGSACFKASDLLRDCITYARLNLSTPPFPMKGPMDVIFCRNVMIYFDNSVRTRLLLEMHRLLRPGGYLLIGHAETLTGLNVPFESVRPAVYRKN